jgi:hypothetical protein
MKKRILNVIFPLISLFLLIQIAGASEQGVYLNISEPSPIADRTIPINATTNPIAFTVSDSDGGPLIVLCTSSNSELIPNDSDHINIIGEGQRITVEAAKNEKKKLNARIIPACDKFGAATLTFKVIDSGGLFATKSMNLTVTTQTIIMNSDTYAFVPSGMINTLAQRIFASDLSNRFITLSVLGNGTIRMDDHVVDGFQKILTDQAFKIEALPAENWQFVYWSGDVIDTQNPLNLSSQDPLNIQAVFVSDEEQQQSLQKWQLYLMLSEKQKPEVPISGISVGISEVPQSTFCDQQNPILSIVTETEMPLSDQILSENKEQFWHVHVAQSTEKELRWEFEPQSSGLFELLDAITYEIYVSDMQSIKQWRIPENMDSVNLLIHYLP